MMYNEFFFFFVNNRLTSHKVWLDIEKINGTEWGNSDGEKMNFTTWASGYPGSTYNFGYWYNRAMYTHQNTTKFGQICQTKAISEC